MILSAIDYGLSITLDEKYINVVVLENPDIFANIVYGLWNPKEDIFTLYDGDKNYKIEKELECIINPLMLNCNDRKITSKIMQLVEDEAKESFQQESNEIRTKILEYIEKLIQWMPYEISLNYDFEIEDLCKAVGVSVADEYDTLLERIISYIRLRHALCDINIFVMTNIKSYLRNGEIEELYRFAFYEKVHIIMIESKVYENLSNEKIIVVDKDMCIIDMN